MAYMDGQMSASEALDFEQSLTSRDRARLGGEVRLESAICDRLAGDACCPAAVWAKLISDMKRPAVTRRGWTYWLPRVTTVLAATTAILIGAPYYEDLYGAERHRMGRHISLPESTREEFSRGLEATTSLAAAQTYLQENNINLRLVHQTGAGGVHQHDLEYLGICRGKCPEGTLYELRFWCCGKPAKLMIARRQTEGERVLRHATRCGDVRDSRVDDEFITAVICGHEVPDLLGMIQPLRGKFT